MVAAAILLLWLNGIWFGNVGAASRDGRWGLSIMGGRIDVFYCAEPRFRVGSPNAIPVGTVPPPRGLISDPDAFPAGWTSPDMSPLVDAAWLSDGTGWGWLPSVTYWSPMYRHVMVPVWMLALPFVGAAWWSERRRRRWCRQSGLCAKCGHDRAPLAATAPCAVCEARRASGADRVRPGVGTWLGRACGLVAVAFLFLWLNGQWIGNVVAASRDGRWALWAHSGRVEFLFSQEPAFRAGRPPGFMLLPPRRTLAQETIFLVLFDDTPLAVHRGLIDDPATFDREYTRDTTPRPLINGSLRFAGEGWSWLPAAPEWTAKRRRISLPLWCLALPFAARAFVTERRHRRLVTRARIGKCLNCGYDRAGVPAEAVCPECGKKP